MAEKEKLMAICNVLLKSGSTGYLLRRNALRTTICVILSDDLRKEESHEFS